MGRRTAVGAQADPAAPGSVAPAPKYRGGLLTAGAIALALLLGGCQTGRSATEVEPDRQSSAASSPADAFLEDQTAEMAADDQHRAATATERTKPSVTHRDSPLPPRRRP